LSALRNTSIFFFSLQRYLSVNSLFFKGALLIGLRLSLRFLL
jgi:hypothetical protein